MWIPCDGSCREILQAERRPLWPDSGSASRLCSGSGSAQRVMAAAASESVRSKPRVISNLAHESGSHDLWAPAIEAAGQQMQTAAPATPGRYHSPAKLSLEFSPPLPPPLPSRHVWSSPHPRELCKSECTCSLALLETSYPGRARLLQRRGCQLSVRLVLVLQNIHDL